MADEKEPTLGEQLAGSVYRGAKATLAFLADNVIYGKAAQQGAAEAANALFAGTAYVPYGAGQQPAEVADNDNSPSNNTLHQGVPVIEQAQQADAVPQANPSEPQPLVHGPVDPLQRAAENARAFRESAQDKAQHRGYEIG